jgi:hypothetical protein
MTTDPSAPAYPAGVVRELIEELMDYCEVPPDENCSCMVSPPCSDCVDFSHLRDVRNRARALIAALNAQKGAV